MRYNVQNSKKADMKCLCLECGLVQSVKNDFCEKCNTDRITMFDASTDSIDWVLKQAGIDFLEVDESGSD